MHLVCGWTALGSSTADGEGGFSTGKHGNSGAGRLYTSLDARGRGAVGEAGQEQQPWPGGSAAEFTIWRRLGVATQDTSRRRLGGRRHDKAEKHMKEMDRQRGSPARKGSWVPAAAGQAGTLPKNISRLTWRPWSSVLVRLRLDRALAPRAHGHGDPLWGVDAASITPGDAMIPGAEGWRWGNGRGRAAVLFGG